MPGSVVEHVLAFPTVLLDRIGRFDGLRIDPDRYLAAILAPENARFLPRHEAENDPGHKQVIPYCILRCGDLVFHYRRGGRSGEVRLRGQGSIGIGGHINPADRTLFSLDTFYDEAVRREVAEEVEIDAPYRERVVAVLNEDATAVGGVHFGVVHLFDLEAPRVRAREAKLLGAGFATLSELSARRDDFEGWSVTCIDALLSGTLR